MDLSSVFSIYVAHWLRDSNRACRYHRSYAKKHIRFFAALAADERDMGALFDMWLQRNRSILHFATERALQRECARAYGARHCCC